MKYVDHVLSKIEIEELRKLYAPYTKITVDLGNQTLVIGCKLHADGETILLEKGGNQDDIWGGGINFETNEFDTTAVLNLRPSLQNNSIEILDPQRREQFFKIVNTIFDNIST